MTIHIDKSLKEIISNVVSDVFDIMKRSCKYGHTSYDENHIADWTCHHDCNKPNGSSWVNVIWRIARCLEPAIWTRTEGVYIFSRYRNNRRRDMR